MSIKHIFEDNEPISHNKYKYVLFESILLSIICMGTYMTIGLASNLIVLVIGFILFIMLIYLISKFEFNLIQLKPLEKQHIIYGLLATILSLAIYWIVSSIIGQPTNQIDVYKDLRTLPIYISIIIFVILGPIFEELIFRGFILKGIFKGHLLAGFIISSILFGLIHGPAGIGEFVIYFALGLIFGALYLITNRIEIAIICHGLNNLVHIIIFLVLYN